MAALILQFEDTVVREYSAGPMVTIGRLPDNTIVINHPAVSSHHACIFRDGDHFVVEDLQSSNGVFVNERRVARQILQQGDVVLVGEHKLLFDALKSGETANTPEAQPTIPNQGETVFLDKRQHRALLNRLLDAEAHASRADASMPSEKVAALRVLAGNTDQSQYALERHTSLIGGGKGCLVRLRGWFKPNVAVAITRNRLGYVATLLGGSAFINNQRLGERYELNDGDILQVSGLTLEFRSQASSRDNQNPAPEPAPSDSQHA